MSRKDPRRAMALALPPAVLARLRTRQKRSRGRRLMDTLRVTLHQALAVPSPVLAPCPPAPPGTSIRLLQLPRDLHARLSAFSRDRGMPEADAICALVMGLDAPEPVARAPDAPDAPGQGGAQRRTV